MIKQLKTVFILIFFFMFPVSVLAQGNWTHITAINGKEIGYVTDIASEKDGTIWICSSGGTFRYKENSWIDESAHFFEFREDIFEYPIDLVVAPNGDLWFSGNIDYLVKYDGENWYHYEKPPPVAQRYRDIGVDSNGIVWCAVDGIIRFDGNTWDVYSTEDGLCQRVVQRIAVSKDGDVWCRYADPYWCEGSTQCGRYGVSHFTGDSWETYNTDNGLISNYVDGIEFDSEGSVYIGYVNGISRYDGSTWEVFSETASGELTFDRDENLWAVSKLPHRILHKYNGSSWETYYPPIPAETAYLLGTMGFDADGMVWLATNNGIFVFDISTGITEENNPEPQEYIFLTNYPNPFNSATTISFELPKPSWASLHIYNTAGQKIFTLVEEFMPAGMHTVTFNGSNFASGIYFYRFGSPGFEKKGKMLLVK